MKIALITYHANAEKIYKPEWIEQFKQSILNQTYNKFTIFECEYSGGNYRIFENSKYESKKLPTFVDAMNHLLDKCFSAGYDYCANVNCDDYYALTRIEKQLVYMNLGYDLISSNFSLVKDDIVTHTHNFHELNIEHELGKNNNVICHPCVTYSKGFWMANVYVPSEVPFEDMYLWQRAIKDYKFIILPEVLCMHRLHSNSVCQNENNR